MREIIAIIRPTMVAATKKALVEAGIPALTGTRCAGRGSQNVEFSLSGEQSVSVPQEGGLMPKYLLDIAAPKESVGRIVDIIRIVNHSGHAGDGKIFVLPLEDVIRMRTGERGRNAVDEMLP